MSNHDETGERAFERAIENIHANLNQHSGRLGGTVRSTRRGWRWSVPPAGGMGIDYEIALDRDGVFVVVNHRGQHLDERRRQLIDALAADGCHVTVLRAPGEPVRPRAAGARTSAANGDREAGPESMDGVSDSAGLDPDRDQDDGRQNRRLVIIEQPDTQLATIDLAFTALSEQGEVYRRGRQLCYPDRSVKVQTRQGEGRQLSVQEIRVATLKAFLGNAASFLRRNKSGQLVPAFPSDRLCNQLLDHVGDRPVPLPPLKGVRTAPFLRPDGTVCQEPGYDCATALFYDPCGTVFPPMPEITPANALELAKQAVKRLSAPYREFVFDTSQRAADRTWDLEVDTSRAILISALPTLLSTAATRTRPGIAVEAPTIASGKTLAIELPIIAALGDDPALISAEKEVNEDDLAKAMRSALLAARGYILLDNVQGPASRIPELTTLLTAAKLSIRLFFKQELAESENTFLVLLSGNNMELNAEIGRRILRARIDTGEARPDRIEHSFDPRAEILVNRPQLVIDALTILRAYVVAGRPVQKGVRYGSFEEWARTVRDALMWAGLPDIVQSIDEAFRDDTGTAILRAVIDEITKTVGMSVPFTARRLANLVDESTGGPGNSALRDALMAAINPTGRGRVSLNAITVGRWLKQVDGKWDGEGTEARCIARVRGRKDNSVHYCCEKKPTEPELPF